MAFIVRTIHIATRTIRPLWDAARGATVLGGDPLEVTLSERDLP